MLVNNALQISQQSSYSHHNPLKRCCHCQYCTEKKQNHLRNACQTTPPSSTQGNKGSGMQLIQLLQFCLELFNLEPHAALQLGLLISWQSAQQGGPALQHTTNSLAGNFC